ncbi:hypothetical protein ACWCP8_35185 [Streptomyces sp. NPDC002206]
MDQGTGQEAEPVVAALGLSQMQERICLMLPASGGKHFEQLAGILALTAQAAATDLSGLAAIGLVTRQDHAAGNRYTAVAPDVAVAAR